VTFSSAPTAEFGTDGQCSRTNDNNLKIVGSGFVLASDIPLDLE
jgi:hypothetical protein